MRVFIVLDYNKQNQARIDRIYYNSLDAEARCRRLELKQASSKVQAKNYHSYHIIIKKLTGLFKDSVMLTKLLRLK